MNLNSFEKIIKNDSKEIKKSFSITIKDVDTIVLNYIKNNIQPYIIENNIKRKVPIYFADAQLWNQIQKNGYIRDSKTSKILLPAIAIKNTGIGKDPKMPISNVNKLYEKVLIKKNLNKNIFEDKNEQYEYYIIPIPDYVLISYQIFIWTAYINHINLILENFIFHENLYWGNENLKFRVKYDKIENSSEITEGENRIIKANINIEVDAYLLPENYNNEEIIKRKISPSKVIFKTETIIKGENE